MEWSKQLIGLIGIFLGFLLSEVATYFRTRRAEKKEKKRTRTLLRLEIEQNLERLQNQIWRSLQQYEKPGMSPGVARDVMTEFNRYSVLHEFTLPIWDHNAWNSVKALVTKALSDEEIKALYRHHAEIEQLNIVHSEILKLHTKYESEPIPYNKEQIHYTQKDIYEKQYEPQLKKILAIGNPLEEVTSVKH